jgi:hypothetical protein
MKEDDKLNKKLLSYYDKLHKPTLVIGDWNIVDEKQYKNLGKITLTAISDIKENKNETIISAESKNKFVLFKYNPAFIASKVIDTEYDYLLNDWSLIAVNKKYIYDGLVEKEITPKIVFGITGIKLSLKAKKDLSCFV